MVQPWVRVVQLLIADKDGAALDLSALRVSFNVKKTETETPNTAEIQIFNVSEELAYRTSMKEFVGVRLSVGARNVKPEVVYEGEITGFQLQEDGVDATLTLECGDGDASYNNAVVNASLAAGASTRDVTKLTMEQLRKEGAFSGSIDDDGDDLDKPSIRGRAIYDSGKQTLRAAAKDAGCTWSIQNGKPKTSKRNKSKGESESPKSYTIGERSAVALTPDNGLQGSPIRRNDSIFATAAIDPSIEVGSIIKIDGTRFANGVWRVADVTHIGDTHGSGFSTQFNAVDVGVAT